MDTEYPGRELEAMTFASNYHQWILDEFAPHLRGRVAEVGAGIGDLSEMILQRNVDELLAFEPATNLFSALAVKLNEQPTARAINESFGSEAERESFDAIAYVNVLEHIAKDQDELERAYQGLKPGGHLLLFVPALAFLYSNADRAMGHFRRYTRRDLRQLAESVGFEIIKCRYFDIAGIIPWYIFFVVLKRSLGQASVKTYDNWVVPPMRRVERLLPPPIGKNIVLVARRPE